MASSDVNIKITGMGVVTPVGIGISQFTTALREGRTNFSTVEFEHNSQLFQFPAGTVNAFNFKELVANLNISQETIDRARRLRHISTSAAYGIYCALEAWADAGLHEADIDMANVAIVTGGTNTQQATLQMAQDEYREKLQFMNPNYGLYFLDTDLAGALSDVLAIKGESHAIGAASASGNMAIIQGYRLISSGEYDIVLVVTPLMDLSKYEYQGFTALGAMAKLSEDVDPNTLCKPFDQSRSGFVYGQCAGCLVLESEKHAVKRGRQSYGAIAGYGTSLDGNRNPNPSVEGEKNAMLKAIKMSGIYIKEIDYINTHGTASIIGDTVEVEALLSIGLEGVKANSTKSLTGHGISAAGLIEIIASLLQMKEGFLHTNHNLTHPITDKIDWIMEKSRQANIGCIMSNSLGFGGINTSLILKK